MYQTEYYTIILLIYVQLAQKGKLPVKGQQKISRTRPSAKKQKSEGSKKTAAYTYGMFLYYF